MVHAWYSWAPTAYQKNPWGEADGKRGEQRNVVDVGRDVR